MCLMNKNREHRPDDTLILKRWGQLQKNLKDFQKSIAS